MIFRTSTFIEIREKIRKYLALGLVTAMIYFAMANHYIICQGTVSVLPKKKMAAAHTVYRVDGKSPETILKVDALRWAGIGDILVKKGLISPERLLVLEDRAERQRGSGGETSRGDADFGK